MSKLIKNKTRWFGRFTAIVALLVCGMPALSSQAKVFIAVSAVESLNGADSSPCDALPDGKCRVWLPTVMGPRLQAAKIATGGGTTCALTTTGAVKCWGGASFGSLGNGSNTDSNKPVDVIGLSNGVSDINTRNGVTCAITTAGAVKCWGGLPFETLYEPVEVTSLSSGVKAISVNGDHGCALTNIGAVKCWGVNEYGQLGNGSTISSSTPVDVIGLNIGVIAISVGSYFSCALTSGGAVKCWGWNFFGDLGNNSRSNSATPVDVVGLSSGVKAISAGGEHTCALTSAGTVKCWGRGASGELGNGTFDALRSTPVDVIGLGSEVNAIATGSGQSCALTGAGVIKCWGGNSYGELGNGSPNYFNTPVNVTELSGIKAISVGGGHICAITSAGGVKCWGFNFYGQLGNGSRTTTSTPVDVIGF